MARILVFDSGVGGLSILRALQKSPELQQERHQWLFCSDNAYFPYGTKRDDDLIQRVTDVLLALQNQYRPDIIVLACNTASTVALDAARQSLRTPIVGVVPAIKPAAQLSQSRCIGLLATPATVNRPYTDKLIAEFAPDCKVVKLGTSELVWMAETFLRHGMLDNTQLHRVLAPLRTAIALDQMDTVVLACTHFPLLADPLHEQLPEIHHWVDSGEAIARRVSWCLSQQDAERAGLADNIRNLALFTRLDSSARELERALGYFSLNEMHQLELPLTDL